MSIKSTQVKRTYILYVHNIYNHIDQYPKNLAAKTVIMLMYVNISFLVHFICLNYPSKVIVTVAK